jgi:cytidylate kinase
MVIAIDGPSGSGKTSTAKLLAKKINFYYCDSGSLYRAVTYHLIRKKVDLDDTLRIVNELNSLDIEYDITSNTINLNNTNITNYLRSDEVTKNVSKVSSMKLVRDFLITSQRELGESNNIIVDGRDIGTTVFPRADYKFYLDAEIETRARRRFDEINIEGNQHNYKSILEMMQKRDSYDQNRNCSPLRKAADAISIDTTALSLEEQVDKIICIINQ